MFSFKTLFNGKFNQLSQTGYSFGYAFVDFASELDAQNAIKSLNGVTVRNKRLKVRKKKQFVNKQKYVTYG